MKHLNPSHGPLRPFITWPCSPLFSALWLKSHIRTYVWFPHPRAFSSGPFSSLLDRPLLSHTRSCCCSLKLHNRHHRSSGEMSLSCTPQHSGLILAESPIQLCCNDLLLCICQSNLTIWASETKIVFEVQQTHNTLLSNKCAIDSYDSKCVKEPVNIKTWLIRARWIHFYWCTNKKFSVDI